MVLDMLSASKSKLSRLSADALGQVNSMSNAYLISCRRQMGSNSRPGGTPGKK
jgi:hypothetical protein